MLKRIAVKQLAVGMFVDGFDRAWLSHPFWRTRFAIKDEARLKEVQASGISHCWIDVSKGADLQADTALEETATAAILEELAPPRPQRVALAEELERARRLRARSAEAMRQMFTEARLGNAIEPNACAPLVNDVVESINRHPDALLSLLRLKTADEYTYIHSVAVCALMVALARQLGFSEARCHEAGTAGLLHDLGKAAMPLEILNKPGKLTHQEFAIIRQHPVRGFEMLCDSGAASEAVMDVCRHHHERADGKGYPDGLTLERNSQLAKMGAVCDVYDAITSDRPYKAGWDPAHALSQMAAWEGHFDTQVFQSFVKCLGIYPIGSLVRLRSGRLAVVLEQNAAALTRPRIKVFFSTKAGLPLEPHVIDLASPHATDLIESREPPEKWKFSYLMELWEAGAAFKHARG